MKSKLIFPSICLLALLTLPLLQDASAQASPSIRSGLLEFSNCSPNATAGLPGQHACGSDAAIPGAKVTFQDLIKLISSSPRTSLGQFDLSEGAGPTAFPPSGQFSYLSVGDSQTAKLVILESNSGMLAYFQVLPEAKLLDWVGIAQDQRVNLVPEMGVYAARPGEFLFWTSNSHHNSGESFNIYNLIYAGSQKVDVAYDGPFLYSYFLPGDCAITQTLAPVKIQSADQGFPRLGMQVLEEKRCQRNGKEVVAATRKFEATLHWDKAKAKYLGGSKELFGLNRCRTEGKANCGN